MTKETQFDYDKENDTLFIYKKEAIKGSIDVGNYIVDFTHEGNVAGIEIMNASEVLRNLGVEKPSDFLDNMKQVKFNAIQKKDSVSVYFVILSKTEVSLSIAIPVCR